LAINDISLEVLACYIFYRYGRMKIVNSSLVILLHVRLIPWNTATYGSYSYNVTFIICKRHSNSSLITWKHCIIWLLTWKGTNSTVHNRINNNRIIAHPTNVNLDSGFILKFQIYSECCFSLLSNVSIGNLSCLSNIQFYYYLVLWIAQIRNVWMSHLLKETMIVLCNNTRSAMLIFGWNSYM